MSRILVAGSIPSIAATFRGTPPITMTAISNAANAVATLAAGHATAVGDFVEILSSGWPRLVGRVFRVSAVATNDVTLAGCDTLNVVNFPAGAGAGTARAVATWADLQQVREINVSGGEQQFGQGQYVDSSLQFRWPTNQTPIDVSFGVDDNQTLDFWPHIRASMADLTTRPLRIRDPAGIPRAVGTGIWTFSAAPSMEINEPFRRTISVALANVFTEYST